MECDWSMLNIWALFSMSHEEMMQSIVGRWRLGGKLQILLDPRLMLRICSFSVQEFCMRDCS